MHWICSSNIVKWYLAYILSGFVENKEILKSPIGKNHFTVGSSCRDVFYEKRFDKFPKTDRKVAKVSFK